jgi:hypothetical protein
VAHQCVWPEEFRRIGRPLPWPSPTSDIQNMTGSLAFQTAFGK